MRADGRSNTRVLRVLCGVLGKETVHFFGAIRFFTRLPVPARVGHAAEGLEHAMRYFPAVGVLVGALAALSFSIFASFLPKSPALLASIALTVLLTGVFHEDGWGDMVDGFGNTWTKESALEIMKDSRLGTFGAVALVLMLVARFFILVEVPASRLPSALVAGHAVSRLCVLLIQHSMVYARADGKTKPLAAPIASNELAFAALTAFLPLLLLPLVPAFLAVVFALAALCWLTRLFRRRIGGYTGDCLGAAQQFSEVAFYLGLSCAAS
ncbi:MAG: adenosylcobinamide-GDP ribazoletransferase [Candidatus Accumulibacter sp.]|jgi:adenosylcobinamide-GDP ribazoletransferase|nr:adenosylcobinamide-GDP ribazoletransferase [Accumulibacter sp.]